MKALLIGAVRAYRLVIGSWLAPSCRYSPTCSAYAIEAVTVHGAARGAWLAARRLSRCHPWHAGGHDPVPPVARAACDGSHPGHGA